MKKRVLYIGMIMMMAIPFMACGKNPVAETEQSSNESAVAGENAENTVEDSERKEAEIVLRLGHINAENDPTHDQAKFFAEKVSEKTDGRVKVDIYPSATLGDTRELIEGLGIGTVEIVIDGFGTVETYTSVASLDAMPFLYRDYDHFMKVWQGDVGKELCDAAGSESGLKIFGGTYRGARVITSTKEIHTVEDMKGLKIRVPNLDVYIKTFQGLGATPTPMAMTEVLTGIQQGTVEGQENPTILSYNFGLYDVCDYLIRTNHMYSANVFMLSDSYFSGLEEDVQQAILEAGQEAADYTSQVVANSEEEYFSKWEEQGVEIIDPEIEGFKKACDGLLETEFPNLVELGKRIQEVQ